MKVFFERSIICLLALFLLGAASSTKISRDAKKIIHDDYGLSKMPVCLPKAEIKRQERGSAIGFNKALESALQSLLHDASDVESPLSLLMEDLGDRMPNTIEFARERLVSLLNQSTTFFALVPSTGESCEGKIVHPAEHGETTEQNWIFYLSIPKLSDHLFWVVVDRKVEQPTYNYGFN